MAVDFHISSAEFSLVHAGSVASFLFVDWVMFPSFHCNFGAVDFPWFWVVVYASTFWVAIELFWPR